MLSVFRTFLPSSLKIHQKSCTADKPMVKQAKESSYASKAEAKVNYPKLKRDKRNKSEVKETDQEQKEDRPDKKDANNGGHKDDHKGNGHKGGHHRSHHRHKGGESGPDPEELSATFSKEDFHQPPKDQLSATYSKLEVEDADEPTRALLADIIFNNSVFRDVENRREFEKLLTKFISDKT